MQFSRATMPVAAATARLRSLPIKPLIALEVNPLWQFIHSLRKPGLCPDPVLRIHVCGIHQGWPRQLA
jgi:hypothetical protein